MKQQPAPPNQERDDARLDMLLRAVRAATESFERAATESLDAVGSRDAGSVEVVEKATPTHPGASSGLYIVSSARARVRLLLVFEDGAVATTTRRMLRRQLLTPSFHVCASVTEAATELRAQRFDAVVADVTGRSAEDDLVVLLEAGAHSGEPPVVLLGPETDPIAAAEICRLGANDYLVRDETSEGALARAVLCARARTERTRRILAVAQVDDLTGVANRRPLQGRFVERRDQALREGGGVAMLIVDVDRFKAINDAHGHLVGDRVLSEIASRIVSSVRSGDLVARLGGDEFAVMLDRIEQAPLEGLVERLEAALARPVIIGEQPIAVSASVGYALGAAEETTDLSMLARRADAEMYRRKRDRTRL